MCFGKDQVRHASPYEDTFKSKGGIINLASQESFLGAHPAAKCSSPSLPLSPKQLPGGNEHRWDQGAASPRCTCNQALQLAACFAVMLWGTRQELSAPRPERTRVFNTPSKCHPCTAPGSGQHCSRGKDQHFSIIYTQVRRGPAAQKHPQAPRPGGH